MSIKKIAENADAAVAQLKTRIAQAKSTKPQFITPKPVGIPYYPPEWRWLFELKQDKLELALNLRATTKNKKQRLESMLPRGMKFEPMILQFQLIILQEWADSRDYKDALDKEPYFLPQHGVMIPLVKISSMKKKRPGLDKLRAKLYNKYRI